MVSDKRQTRTIVMCKKDMQIARLQADLDASHQRVACLEEQNKALLTQLSALNEINERAHTYMQSRLDDALKELEEEQDD